MADFDIPLPLLMQAVPGGHVRSSNWVFRCLQAAALRAFRRRVSGYVAWPTSCGQVLLVGVEFSSVRATPGL